MIFAYYLLVALLLWLAILTFVEGATLRPLTWDRILGLWVLTAIIAASWPILLLVGVVSAHIWRPFALEKWNKFIT